jgi:hypothetical protein
MDHYGPGNEGIGVFGGGNEEAEYLRQKNRQTGKKE